MNKGIIFLCLLVGSISSFAQSITGRVSTIFDEPISNAIITWKGIGIEAISDDDGQFTIEKSSEKCSILVISRLGYIHEEIVVNDRTHWNVQLIEDANLQEIVVSAKGSASTYINEVAKVEALGVREIQRAACCSLAGCFSTNSNVDANTTNVITDAKELRLLGLAGVYNQILIEGHPLVQGIALPYGPGSYPGTMIEKIFISKGTNSVLQGFESISGQINIDFHNPENAPKYFFNAFANSFGETQYNVNHMYKSPNSSNLTTVHLTTPAMEIDGDGDGFRDIVRTKRMSIFNKWAYGNPDGNLKTSLGIRFLSEKREGGQVGFDYEKNKDDGKVFGQHIGISHVEGFGSINYTLGEHSALVWMASAFYQSQNAYLGIKSYDANQSNITSSLYYDYYYSTSNHNLKVGFSHRHNRLEEDIQNRYQAYQINYAGIYHNDYDIPGIFVENKLNAGVFTILTGMRMDRFDRHGWKATPRLLVRAKVNDNHDIRASIGKGYRMPHIFAENQSLFAGNRQVIIANDLRPEDAFNTGINHIYSYFYNEFKLTLSTDLYHTYFFNQIFPDYDKVANTAIIDNNDGKSISNSLAFESKLEFNQNFDIKLAYNYLDVYRELDGVKQPLPFVSNHKITANTSYSLPSDKHQIDLTYRWYSSRTIPSTSQYPEAYQLPDLSPSYGLWDLQYTRRWKTFQVYGGIENIFAFRQNNPILGSDNPFGEYLDASFNWGPTKGREFFIGLRLSVAD